MQNGEHSQPQPVQEESRLRLIVTGGHSQSLVLVVGPDFEIVGSAKVPRPMSPHLFPGPKELSLIMRETLDEAGRSCGFRNIDNRVASVCLSIPGAARASEAQVVLRSLEMCGAANGSSVHVADDTVAGLLAGTLPHSKSTGICAFAGTGASVYAGDAHSGRKFDGWGPVLGDHGSAFNIALRALRNLCLAYNMDPEAESGFASLVVNHPMLARDRIQGWFDSICTNGTMNGSPSWYVEVAAKAEAIGQAADQGDVLMASFVRDAAAAMAKTVRRARDHLSSIPRPLLVLHGSVFVNCKTYRETVINLVSHDLAWGHVGIAKYRIAIGALAYGLLREGASISSVSVAVERMVTSAGDRFLPDLIYQIPVVGQESRS